MNQKTYSVILSVLCVNKLQTRNVSCIVPSVMCLVSGGHREITGLNKSNACVCYLQGLNLDDCNSTYHQIQRSLVQGPYQDVINNDEDDIQLEKP